MLSHANNQLLCQVGPGTAFGNLARRYWLPALRSSALEAGGAPQRLRLLGENFVAFRAADGRVGFFDEACPHRGTSLALARSGDNALTCVYHGWKIDVGGRVVDTPNEAPARREKFAASIPVRSFPTREAGGVLWVWLGEAPAAEFPAFEFNTVPEGHLVTLRGEARSSWLQGMESALDSSHLGILHQSAIRASTVKSVQELQKTLDLIPSFEVEATPYGLKEAALRELPDGSQYVRVREVVLPFFNFISMPQGATCTMFCFVPIDDHHHAQWLFYYRGDRPVDPREVLQPDEGASYDNFAAGMGDAGNLWGQDRAKMSAGHWSGLPGIVPVEDIAVAESMGPLVDRSKEHLGASDIVVAQTRQRLLEMLREDNAGMHAKGIDYARIRSIALRCRDLNWQEIDAFHPPAPLADPVAAAKADA